MKALAAALIAGTLLFAANANALPMYALRSGRTCGNCHVSPTFEDQNGWNNPELAARKCSMSCMACHTNPTGGGLRNTSGRYYGQSTLSMLPLQERSYSDYGREALPDSMVRGYQSSFRWERDTTSTSSTPGMRAHLFAGRTIPSNYEEAVAGVGQGQRGGWSSFGRPLGSPSEYAFWDGRYGDLNADPMIAIGADLRFAYWSGSGNFFPMQDDLHLSVHPVEHVTAMGTLAVRGRAGGIGDVLNQEQFPLFPRNAFLMVHELPYMSYLKAGIFLPAFGTHVDDHTSFIREYFEMDVSESHDTALGVEFGLAPNYPFASVSFFQNMPMADTPDGTDLGWGGAFNLGWRDLGWSLTAHGMMKRRGLQARGNLDAIGVAYGFNPFAFWNSVPLTLMGEFSLGHGQRPLTGSEHDFYAMYHELWVTIVNGLSFRAKYDLGNRDTELSNNVEQRISGALDVSPIPGLTLIGQVRYLLPEEGDRSGFDVFVQTHVWF